MSDQKVSVNWGAGGTALVITQGRYAISVPQEQIRDFAARVAEMAGQV